MERKIHNWAATWGIISVLCGVIFVNTEYSPIIIPQYMFFVLYLAFSLKYYRVKREKRQLIDSQLVL